MAVTAAALTPESIVRLEDATLVMLDQRRLPGERVELRFDRWQDVIEAIRTMAVRGAPAIGIAAAYAVAMAALRSPAGSLEGMRDDVERACVGLAGARPTAVNLAWAVDRMRETAAAPLAGPDELREALVERANAIHTDEVERCRRIGEHGAELLRAGAQVLTHCNAGALATGGYGTALGVIRSAHRRDPRLHVWVDETRPLLQGARLTAWELEQDGIPAHLLTDSSAAWLMAQGKVDAVDHRRRPDRPQRRRREQDRHLRAGGGGPRPCRSRSMSPRRPRRSTPAPPPARRFRSSTGHPPRWRARPPPTATASTTPPSMSPRPT